MCAMLKSIGHQTNTFGQSSSRWGQNVRRKCSGASQDDSGFKIIKTSVIKRWPTQSTIAMISTSIKRYETQRHRTCRWEPAVEFLPRIKGAGRGRGEEARRRKERGGAIQLVRNGRRRRDQLSQIPISSSRHVPSLLLLSSSSASSRCRDRIRSTKRSRVCRADTRCDLLLVPFQARPLRWSPPQDRSPGISTSSISFDSIQVLDLFHHLKDDLSCL